MIEFITEKLKANKVKFDNLEFLAGDASPRRYFLIKNREIKNILMYDDDRINLEKFIYLSNNLKNLVSVPKIIRNLKESGIIIIENFNLKYGEILNLQNQKTLYQVALDALIYIQTKDINFKILDYSKDVFIKESNLFFEWFLKNRENHKKLEEMKLVFNNIFEKYLDEVLNLPKVFIHRDYHIDNLFYLDQRESHFKCGWIDYQDALMGPCVYDLVSLCQDARVDVEKKIEKDIIENYLGRFNTISKNLFKFSYTTIAIQRHLKVLGIFSRLAERDNKTNYIKFIPRVKKLLIENLQMKDFLPLSKIIKPLIETKYDK